MKISKCIQCNCDIRHKSTLNPKYCSKKCQSVYEYKEWIRLWKDGLKSGIRGKSGNISNPIRRYLFEKYNSRCCKCGWSEINPITNKVPLQVNHIDGNYENNKEDNLELICPNCHSLTKNYGNLNKGNGRNKRYSEG